jgi:uncharacterized repeat protein (TIGR01451 family)
MSASIIIAISLALACIFAIATRRSSIIVNLLRRRKALAVLTGSMLLLTLSLSTRFSSLYSLGLAAFICGMLWQLGYRKGRLFCLISPRQRKALLISLAGSLGAILFSCLPWLSLSMRLGLGGLLLVLSLGVAIAHFIRLRAWVLTSLIVVSSFGAIFLEATLSEPSQAQIVSSNTETMNAGAYIIDMGQATQTVANGLKPYGLVYELVVKRAVPVKWAISPNKTRESVDFTANSKSYSGGSFIVPAEYAAEAKSAVDAWKLQGVVVDGGTSSSMPTFSAPIYSTITNFPNAVLDFQNGSIAQAYFTNAGIPASATGSFGSFNTYRFGYPSSLTSCDDIFVMPHADPTWANHQNLIPFVQNRGFVWAACHAVSVLERLDDPGDADTLPDMNFLSHVPPAIQDSKSLKLFGSHALPTVGPYQYANTSNALPYGYSGSNLWAYPIMQFLGKIDLATQNGSEQIYIPDAGAQWRNETAIAAYDQSNTDAVVAGTATPPASQQKAAKMAFGPAYGNANNGMVMYEAGHSHAKATGPDHVAAQRAFFNFVLLNGLVRGIKVDVDIPASITAGSTVNLATSNNGGPAAKVSGGNGSFSYRWYSSCGGTFSNSTAANPTFTAPTSGTVCTLRVVVNDGCNRRSFGADTAIIAPAPPAPKQVDLEVFKTDGQTQALTDNNTGTTETVTYTVSVKNNGPNSIDSFTLNDATKVTHSGVNDTDLAFPSGLTIAPTSIATLSTGAVNTANKGSMSGNTWTATTGVPLAAGQVLSFNVTGNLNTSSAINTTDPNGSADPDLLINTASITVPSGYIDTNSANNSSTDTDEIRNQVVDISVTKIDDLAADNDLTDTFKGKFINYKITVKNEGNVSIAGVQLRDYTYNGDTGGGRSLGTVWTKNTSTTADDGPSDAYDATYPTTAVLGSDNTAYGRREDNTFAADFTVTNVSRGTGPTTLKGNGTAVNWTGLNLAPGESATLALTGLVNKDQTRNYLANVMRAEPLTASNGAVTDSNTANNTFYDVNKLVTTPGTTLDLSIAKNHSPLAPRPGDILTYKVILQNLSTVDAASANVNLTDSVPSSITVTNWSCAITDSGKDAANTSCGTPSSGTTNNIGGITGLKLSKSDTNGSITTLTYTIIGKVNANASGTISNTATVAVASAQTDQKLANNSASDSFNIPAYKMSIAKTDGLAQVKTGDSVTYTVTATNHGTDNPIAAIKVLDDLAQGHLLNPTYTAGVGTYNGATGDWTGLSIASGQTATLTIAGTVASNTPLGTGTFINTATLTVPSGIILQNSGGTSVTSLTAQDSDDVIPSADLAIDTTDNQTSAVPGEAISYTLTVKNNGPSPVSSVKITDIVPAQILNSNVSGPDGATLNNTSGYWEGLNLQAGDSAVFALSGTVDPVATGNLTNTATVVTPAGIVDPNSANNSSTDTDTLSPKADISISKSDGKSAVNPGDAIAYTVKVANNGPSVANNIVLIDNVPNDITGVSWTCAVTAGNGTCGTASGSGNAINTTVTLNRGATATYTIQGTVRSTAPNPGTLTNTASVTLPSGTTDPNLTNNSSTDSDKIPIPTGVVDLSIAKNDGQTQAISGSPATYSIEVANNSPTVTVNGVKVIDILPPASQFTDVFFSSPNGTYDAATGEWDITLLPGEKALLLVDGAVPLTASSGSLTNTATVYPPDGFTDPDCAGSVCSGNNTATDTDTIIGPSSSAPNVLLVKRITGINGDPSSNPNDNTPLDRFENLTTGPQSNDDDHPHWPHDYLHGAIDGGKVKPGDQVDYTIYFLSAGDKDAAKVKICDRIPQNQTFATIAFGAEHGIQAEVNGQTLSYTNRIDGDAAAFYPPGQSLPSFCGADGSDSNINPTGAIVVDLGTLPKSNGPGTPSGSYGFINFRAKVE